MGPGLGFPKTNPTNRFSFLFLSIENLKTKKSLCFPPGPLHFSNKKPPFPLGKSLKHGKVGCSPKIHISDSQETPFLLNCSRFEQLISVNPQKNKCKSSHSGRKGEKNPFFFPKEKKQDDLFKPEGGPGPFISGCL